jgi:predicted ABC-type transport system involved in lysophospholipase L1 biosynthesis ATPase subunit
MSAAAPAPARAQMALRYQRKGPRHEVAVAVPLGSVRHVHLPDDDSRAHFVTAVLKARCEEGEELELFGEPVRELRSGARERVRARVGALSPIVGLISNLNAWENIALPAAYHGKPPLAEVVRVTHEVLEIFGTDPRVFLNRLPDQLGALERRIAAFARLLTAPPELAIIDALDEGLSRAEAARVAGFEKEYRQRHPAGTLLFVTTQEEED